MWELLKDEIRNFQWRVAVIVTLALISILGATCLIAFFATLKLFWFILYGVTATVIWSLCYFVTVNVIRRRYTARVTQS